VIEQRAVGVTDTASVAYAPWLIGEVTERSRTLAAADAGTAALTVTAAISARRRKTG
jgi:hypothetical protein